MLTISNLKFSYDDQPLLEIEQFQAAANERIAVLGPSGCGKTTFMHLIAGLIRPQEGSVVIHGTDITKLSETEVDRIRGRHIGIVFQRLHLIPSISVINNLLLAQRLAGVSYDRAYAEELLAKLDISALVNKFPTELSQGQAQRVAIARAMTHRPSLIIADEPTSALDDSNATEAIKVLQELTANSSAALLVVTHDSRVKGAMKRVYHLDAAS